ncbi:MAG: hypothetical protein Q9M97_10535, partial [Candidatus Gracilibacteria bacterium]|nr:hypothetical protein [Candidatus Gracilibacteria bacterium]
TSPLEKTEIEKVEKLLDEKYTISRENGKLAVYLSEDKTDNLDDIAKGEIRSSEFGFLSKQLQLVGIVLELKFWLCLEKSNL